MNTGATFAGKVALVTGGSRGIGRAIAVLLARRGADVVVNYRRRGDDAARTVEAIEAAGRRGLAVQADLSSDEEITRLFATVQSAFGSVDILISNAAAGRQSRLVDASAKGWDLAMNVNARAYLLCAQAAVPLMKARGGGQIVALTSCGAGRAFPNYGTVAASKAAVEALTTYLAVELASDNIIVNAVSPGVVDTEALAAFDAGAEMLARAKALTPTGRTTTVDDVAALVAFLCSGEAPQLTGQIIVIDGGYSRLFL